MSHYEGERIPMSHYEEERIPMSHNEGEHPCLFTKIKNLTDTPLLMKYKPARLSL